jgi:hypothetical protein
LWIRPGNKHFLFVTDGKTLQVSVFGPGNFIGVYHLPVRQMLTRAEQLRELEKEVMLLALPANIRRACKNMTAMYTLTYFVVCQPIERIISGYKHWNTIVAVSTIFSSKLATFSTDLK